VDLFVKLNDFLRIILFFCHKILLHFFYEFFFPRNFLIFIIDEVLKCLNGFLSNLRQFLLFIVKSLLRYLFYSIFGHFRGLIENSRL